MPSQCPPLPPNHTQSGQCHTTVNLQLWRNAILLTQVSGLCILSCLPARRVASTEPTTLLGLFGQLKCVVSGTVTCLRTGIFCMVCKVGVSGEEEAGTGAWPRLLPHLLSAYSRPHIAHTSRGLPPWRRKAGEPAPMAAKKGWHNSSLAVVSMMPHSCTSCASNRMGSSWGELWGCLSLAPSSPELN